MFRLSKLFIVLSLAVFVLCLSRPVLAENVSTADQNITAQDLGIKEPTLLSNSPFYFLKNWGRAIQSAFTFNSLNKLELKEKFANEKLMELKKLSEITNDISILNKATEIYKKELENIKNQAEKIKQKTEDNPKIAKFLDKLKNQQVLQEKILQKLEDKVPSEVFSKIKEARDAHLERFAEVMNKLENKEKAKEDIAKACATIWDPVCGKDGKTYGNECMAKAVNVEVASKGECSNSTDCKNLWWYDNNNKVCQQKQFCGAYMYLGLKTFESKEKCEESLNSPYIKVLSPNGGEVFIKGKDIIVSWISQRVDKVNIYISYYNLNNVVDPNNPINEGECRITYESVSALAGSYVIVGGNTGRCGVLPESSKIKIEISGYDSNNLSLKVNDQSDNYFSIIANSTI